MAIGSEEFLGKLISEELSNYLRTYTDKFDRINITQMDSINVGVSTMREVIYRNVNLTVDNAMAINELMKIAIQNCMKLRKDSIKAEKGLKSKQKELKVMLR